MLKVKMKEMVTSSFFLSDNYDSWVCFVNRTNIWTVSFQSWEELLIWFPASIHLKLLPFKRGFPTLQLY